MPFLSNSYKNSTTDGRNRTCLEALEFTTYGDRKFRIPVGATSDGPSWPHFIEDLIRKQAGKVFLPSIAHDAGYRRVLEENIAGTWIAAGVTKGEIDELFYQLMIDNGVDKIIAEIIYDAVSEFGFKAYLNQ